MIYDMDQSLTPQQNIDRWQAREHRERQTAAMESMASRHPQRQGGGASSVGYAGGQLVGNAAAAISAYAGTKAGQNHYERTGDLKEAMWLGAIAGRRWMVWTFGCVAWCLMWLITFCIMMGASMDYSDWKEYGAPGSPVPASVLESRTVFFAWALSIPIVLVLLLVIYWRNVNFSLAKRRTIYYIIQPVAKLLFWAPNWLLYAGFVIVPVTLQSIL